MSEEIIKVLDDLGKRLGIAIDWSNQNIIPYLQDLMSRFVTLQNSKAITWIILCLIGFIIGIILIIKLNKWKKSEKFDNSYSSDDSFVFYTSLCLMIFFQIVFLIILLCNLFGLYQNIFMPEFTMLQYIKEL